MKKIILPVFLSILVCQYLPAKKLFVEMEFHKNCIKLDDGTNKKRQPIKGADGKDLKFTSLVGAINYMSLQGWELIDTKSVTSGGGYVIGGYGGSSSTDTKVYYIFSREVSDEELESAVNNSYKE